MNEQQLKVIEYIQKGHNVFFTGVAGTGKSHLIKELRKIYPDEKELVITSPTGVSSILVGGKTIHSFSGCGIVNCADDFLKMSKTSTLRAKWRKVKILIIDEISMLAADFIDWMDVHVRNIRKKPHLPFGGIQLILCGDFMQLQPVPGKHSSLVEVADETYFPVGIKNATFMIFHSVLWKQGNFKHVLLTKVMRQIDGEDCDMFIKGLYQLRNANILHPDFKKMLGRIQIGNDKWNELMTGDIVPTMLYCTNCDVDRINSQKLVDLSSEPQTFKSKDELEVTNRKMTDALVREGNKTLPVCEVLELKIGCQVMLVKNEVLTSKNIYKAKLVNGSRGVVIGFEFGGETLVFPVVKFVNGRTEVIYPEIFEYTMHKVGTFTRLQIPIKLAWAITIHKSQGCSLDYVAVKADDIFTAGQLYVALSRATNINGLFLMGYNPGVVKCCEYSKLLYTSLEDGDEENVKIFVQNIPIWFQMIENIPDVCKSNVIFSKWSEIYPLQWEEEGVCKTRLVTY